jgi:CRISPR type I-E-associated protein CasA/Cse1
MTDLFNLLEEEWIPVLYRNGDYRRVGILRAFEDAGRIREIAASNPMDRVAILRFLLALLYWCKGNPTDEKMAAAVDSFPMDWFQTLEEHRDCFNMLGEGKRFYQNDSYKDLDPEHTTNYLIHEVPAVQTNGISATLRINLTPFVSPVALWDLSACPFSLLPVVRA